MRDDDTRVVFYTVAVGEDVDVLAPAFRDPSARYVAITDGRADVGPGWEHQELPPVPRGKERVASREPKMRPHAFLGQEWDVAVYLDASVAPTLPGACYAGLLAGNRHVATYRHANARCVYAHAAMLIQCGKAHPREMAAAIAWLKDECWPAGLGCMECCLVVWANHPTADRCGRYWERYYLDCPGERDQLTFPMAVARSGARWRWIPGGYGHDGFTHLVASKGPAVAGKHGKVAA